MIRVVLLTGVSGAGKSTACHAFEERGYRLVENVPVSALPAVVSSFLKEEDSYGKTVLLFSCQEAYEAIAYLKTISEIELKVVLLDCNTAELFSRYRLTRHVHPRQADGLSLEEALEKDRVDMEKLRPEAQLYLDTTSLTPKDLQEIILTMIDGKKGSHMVVRLTSFAYKYGVPRDAEVVLDCRLVPNPYWVEELRPFTGVDPEIIFFLESKKEVGDALEAMERYLRHYLSHAEEMNRRYVSVYLGCTGGQHRSVYFAEKLGKLLKKDYSCMISHRDLSRYRKK